jgi:hypothetical protein
VPNSKAYSAASATSPLAPTTIARREPTPHDVQIDILFCGSATPTARTTRSGLTFTSAPEQAIEAHGLVRGGVLIPVHWGTFDLALHPWTEPVERLLVAASQAGVRLAIRRPVETFAPAAPRPVVRWWPDVPSRTAQEAPVVSTGLEPGALVPSASGG